MGEQGRNELPTWGEIEICAYLIWEHEGRPENMDVAHWAQAEEQLIICHAHDHWMVVNHSSP
jgi:Protein of unknown function (DUF2934)